MPKLVAREISSDRFRWIEASRTFVTRSALFAGEGWSGRIWDDSTDEGFVMKSAKTGVKILCIWTGGKWDRSGKKLYDRLLCYDLRGQALLGPLAGAEVQITTD